MILCITEKPAVAADIASLLGARTRRDGYYEGNGYNITWTYGHLCTLKEPADYTPNWKRWSLGSLPMLPPRFGIKIIDNQRYEQQMSVIEKLASQASEIINCGDAGQEGELIQRWVMQKAGVRCPVKRLWTSSLTDDALRAGFKDLRPESDYNNLYFAGLSRAIGDWILGLNATRLYTLKYSEPGKVLSIGRVQTPTLALIVQRQREIDNFKPEDYWEIKTRYREVVFNGQNFRFDNVEKAAELIDRIVSSPLVVTDVQQKRGRESAPRLFDLTSLQVECNKRFGWGADRTLQLIQSLYEKKVTTYPRVDTTYLSDDVYKIIPDILKKMSPYASIIEPLLQRPIPKVKRIFDNSKVTDHHAIIPTGQSPAVLVDDERPLYHLIAQRFIAAFYPDCEFQTTTVNAEVEGVNFRATGKVVENPGWRVVLTPPQKSSKKDDSDSADDSDDDSGKVLPPFVKGEGGPHTPTSVKRVTRPPKYYTEGTLLQAMETAGRTIEDDDELREALKENGIGRPSTRAEIIKTLYKRGYIQSQRKNIQATEAGIRLIDTIDEELLKSARLTGIWEAKLRRIERGDYSAHEFIDELKILINEIVINVLSDNDRGKIHVEEVAENVMDEKHQKGGKRSSARPRAPRVKSLEEIVCPECGQGHLVKGRTAYGCSRFREGCGLRLMFEEYPETLTPARLNTAIKKRKK